MSQPPEVWVTVEFPDAEAAEASRISAVRVATAQPEAGDDCELIYRCRPGSEPELVWTPREDEL